MTALRKHWLKLPDHLRRGLTRLYLVVAVPWVLWYGSQVLEAAQHSGSAAQRAMAHAFWSLLVVPIGGPALLLLIVWVLAGFRKSIPASTGETAPVCKTRGGSPQPHTDHKPPNDLTGAGKMIAKILMEPEECWRQACMLRQYDAPDAVATCEMAFARAAIVRDAIMRCQPKLVADQMLAGIDRYVAEAFANEESAEALEYYEGRPLSLVAPQAIRLYQNNVFPLAQLADVLARRLSVPGLPAIEIAPLFEEVAAEAERLMRVSSALQKLTASATSKARPSKPPETREFHARQSPQSKNSRLFWMA